MWLLINENKQQLDKKKKMQNYVIVVFFFRKKFISKDIKAINYKTKSLNRFVHSSKKALETCNYPEYVLRLQKERQI